MALSKNSKEAMKSWTELNNRLKSLTINDLNTMLRFETSKKGKNRKTFIRRIQQRLNGVLIQKVTKKPI